jgi:hypothetical protein
MKRILSILFVGAVLCFASCKKCYRCTCTDTSTLGGCTQLGEEQELCDEGLFGKSVLTVRVLAKEDEGYSCSVE